MPVIHRKLPALSEQDIKRFWSKVNKASGQGPNGGCWEWKAGRYLKAGYGKFWLSGQTCIASRVLCFIVTGVDPGPLVMRHTCRNPPCCNPEHLLTGTEQDNIDDRERDGQTRRGEKHYCAKLTEEIVREMRKVPVEKWNKPALADENGVSRQCINKVAWGRSWKHVQPDWSAGNPASAQTPS